MLGIVWQVPILFIYEVNKKNHVCDWCVLGLLLFPLFNYTIIQGGFNMKVFSFCETKSLLVWFAMWGARVCEFFVLQKSGIGLLNKIFDFV
jgi:hypothetical protein